MHGRTIALRKRTNALHCTRRTHILSLGSECGLVLSYAHLPTHTCVRGRRTFILSPCASADLSLSYAYMRWRTAHARFFAGRECGLVFALLARSTRRTTRPSCESSPPKREGRFASIPSLDSLLFSKRARHEEDLYRTFVRASAHSVVTP